VAIGHESTRTNSLERLPNENRFANCYIEYDKRIMEAHLRREKHTLKKEMRRLKEERNRMRQHLHRLEGAVAVGGLSVLGDGL
jgi:hypothetical protein